VPPPLARTRSRGRTLDVRSADSKSEAAAAKS
jgi:hypothetical protein